MRKIMAVASAFLFGMTLGAGFASGFEDAAGPRFKSAPTLEQQLEAGRADEFRTSNRILGQNVQDPQGRHIGQISEVIMDVESGQVAYAVVSVDDPAVGRRDLLVPWNAVQVDPAERTYVLDVTAEQLREAPTPELVITPERAREIHEFYGVAPYWTRDRARDEVEMRTHQEPYPWELPSGEIQTRPERGMQE